MSLYTKTITKLAPGYDPRHVEAFIRIAYNTLDELSRHQFQAEVRIAVECINEGGTERAEQLARSYGL